MSKTKGNDGNTIYKHCLDVKNHLLNFLKVFKPLLNQYKEDYKKLPTKTCTEVEALRTFYRTKFYDLFINSFDQNIYPNWFGEYAFDFVRFVDTNWKPLSTGIKFHDCGKPFCHTVDNKGVNHFRGHQELSIEKFKEYDTQFKEDYKSIWARETYYYSKNRRLTHMVIERDFDYHRLKDDDNLEYQLKDMFGFKYSNSYVYDTYNKNFNLFLLYLGHIECIVNFFGKKDFKKYIDKANSVEKYLPLLYGR